MAEALNRKEQNHLLNCGICGGRLMDPQILDCLHTFCKECLIIKQEQAAIKDVLVCQLCNKTTDLPSQSTESLTTNIFASNLGRVDEIVNSNRSFYCSFCDDQCKTESASSRCLTCGDWLCLVCASRHCGTSVTKNHEVVTIDDVRVNPKYLTELRKLYESKCLTHDEKIIEFCRQCNKPTCVECIRTADHKQHHSIPLEDAVNLVKRNLLDLQQMFEGVEECDSESDMQISKRRQEVQSKEKALVQLLHDNRDRLIQNIQHQAETAELLISQKFEAVNLFLSEASTTASQRSENTEKSRLFCERLQREGLPGEFIHFKDLLQRVKRDGYRREQLEFPSVPDVKLNINDFSLPSIFNVFESDQPIVDSAYAQWHPSGDDQNEESIIVTLGPEKPATHGPEKPVTLGPEKTVTLGPERLDKWELNSSGIELIVEPKNESKKFDFRKSGLSFQENMESLSDLNTDSDSEDTGDDGIIPTLSVRDRRPVSLSTPSDKNPVTMSESILDTLGPEKPVTHGPEKTVTLGPEKLDQWELNSSGIELIVEPKNESKKFDFRKSGLSFQENMESLSDLNTDTDGEDTGDESDSDVSDNDLPSKAEVNKRPPLDLPAATPVKQQIKHAKEDDGIIPTLAVKDHRPVSLSTDKNPVTVSDISWLTETEFAVGDKTNQKLKVFNKDGTLSWSKDVNGASLERLACVDGVIAFDYPSGVRLETRNKSFSKVYFHGLTIPFPISETKGKEVIIANADFLQLRCYSTEGKKSEYLPLGRKIDINYISMNDNNEFFFTERNSKMVKKFREGQGVSVFYKGLPEMVLQGIATDSRNNVYVSDSAGGDILKLDPSGNLLGILEVHATNPLGMSISSDDHLLVCEGEGAGNAWIVHL